MVSLAHMYSLMRACKSTKVKYTVKMRQKGAAQAALFLVAMYEAIATRGHFRYIEKEYKR